MNLDNNRTLSREKIGRNAGIVGIFVNLLLFAVKLIVGIVAGSVSAIADAMNNLSDAGSSILLIVGYVIAAKPADKEHPYGHARMEYLCSLFISVIVVVLGLELFISSAKAIFAAEAAQFSLLSLLIMVGAVIAKLGLAVYYRAVAKKIDSDSLRASAADSIGDVCATAGVIIGMVLTPVVGPVADGIIGLLIAVYILIMGTKLVKEACDTILGTKPDDDLVKTIVQKLRSYEGVHGVHDLVLHGYGVDRFFATVHVEVDSNCDVLESHDMIDNMEADFRREMGIQMVIHMDPVTLNDPKTDRLHNGIRDILEDIAAQYSCPLSMHDFRVVFGKSHHNIIFDVAVANDASLKNEEIVDMIRASVKKKFGVEYNVVITVDRDYITTKYE